jgi:hypothetical protein
LEPRQVGVVDFGRHEVAAHQRKQAGGLEVVQSIEFQV